MTCTKCKESFEDPAQLKLNFLNVVQLELDYEDVSELVISDMAKEDFHSGSLLNDNTRDVGFIIQ